MSAASFTAHDNPLTALAELVAHSRFEHLSEAAVKATRIFLLDTLGCGVAGSTAPKVDAVVNAASRWGEGGQATVWGDRRRLPAAQACIANGYRIHALEWDCVHEPAVVHPMATLLPALLAHAERRAQAGQPVDGRQLILSIALGVEIAAMIGAASTSVMRFFRPATCGGFGVVAGLGSMQGLGADTLMNAFGIQYGQTSGTMQAHVEGSTLLGLQVGFNGRAGLTSIDLAEAGLSGPREVLTGQYGYYKLFETSHDIPTWWARLGKQWQITRISHKPFPSGRLTHAAVDAFQQAQRELGFSAEQLASAQIAVPPLAYRLVGRPDIPEPAPNYARLCIPYVGAVTLIDGGCEPEAFATARLSDSAVHRVAARIHVKQDENPDVNALWPQAFDLTLTDGRSWSRVIETPIGHPDNPLSPERHLAKFRRCWALSGMPEEQGEQVISLVDRIESLSDVAVLARQLARRSA
jgi:aconitate decarboxylase